MTLRGFLKLRCPVCEQAELFRGYFDSPKRCPNCGYFFMRESGYFLPHVPIGYGATVFVALSAWPILYYILGVHSYWVTMITMASVAFLFGMWFIRYSKMIWLVFDLKIHPPVNEDFKTRGRQEP